MTFSPLELYKKFLLRINKNDTNKNINIPRGEFVLLYNEQAPLWYDRYIQEHINSDEIEDIVEMYSPDVELTKVEDKDDYSVFALPKDFFRKTSVYTLASKEDCKNVVVVAWDFKPKNKNFNVQNTNVTPSFEYQETNYALSGTNIILYKTDFNIDKTFLSYYRKPLPIDIKGYKHIDGTESTDKTTDLDDLNVEKVLNVCAEIVLGRYENIQGTQVAASVAAKDK